MATRLDERLLVDALTRLSGWAGDERAIHREFVLDAMSRQRLVGDIDALAASTGHDIAVRDTAQGLDVTLATTDVAGVSEVDIALASRLNDLFLGTPTRFVPKQRQARLNEPVTSEAEDSVEDEKQWWDHHDEAEPLIGVPSMSSAVMPVPLPDTAPAEPEPGIEPAQEAGEGLGFFLRGAGDPPQ
jgi:4a-hydroxytetrahydrobiopterin dehydratase